MLIIHDYNYQGSELEMELDFIKTLRGIPLYRPIDGYLQPWKPKIYRQIHIKQIKRRTDVTLTRGTQLINYELKVDLNDIVIQQATDHLEWCDYSNIVVPLHSTRWRNKFPPIVELGLGLVFWTKGMMIEAIPPSFNRSKNKHLSKHVRNFLKSKKEA